MCYLLKKYFWWLLRRVKNLWSTACKHYRKCDVIYRYLHIELIWCLLMVQYLQNNVIMKWTTRFIRFTGWIPLKYGSTTTPPIIAYCQKNSDVKPRISHCDSQNLQYKTHPEFWPSHRRIFKTSLYYKTRLILETRRYVNGRLQALSWLWWRSLHPVNIQATNLEGFRHWFDHLVTVKAFSQPFKCYCLCTGVITVLC